MRTYDDFTGVALGTRIPMEGDISVCPRCGRLGIVEALANDRMEFVHAETEEVMGDGMLIEPTDSCPVTS